MPYVWEPAPMFHRFERNGETVCVYHVFKNDDADNGCVREFWYGLSEAVSDSDSAADGGIGEHGSFDVRNLPTWEAGKGRTARGKQAAIDAAAQAGWFDDWLAVRREGAASRSGAATASEPDELDEEESMPRTVLCTIPVTCSGDVTAAEVVRLLGMLIDVGLSDACDSAEDVNLDDEAREEARLAVSLEIGEVTGSSAIGPASARYAQVAWSVGDVTSITRLSDAEAEAWLTRNQNHIRDRSVELGWDVIKDLLSDDGIEVVEPGAEIDQEE